MSDRLVTLLRHDFRMEKSYGIFAAYGFVVGMYAVILHFAAEHIPTWVVTVIIYTDPTILGFFFLGGLMMLEKSENVRQALAMTPMSAQEYILSKYLTLTVIAVIAVTVLALLTGGANIGLLLITVIPSSLFFVSVGVLVARRKKTVTGYLIGSLPVILPLVAPMFLVLVNPFPIWLIIFPTTAQFWLMLVAMGVVAAPVWQTMLAMAIAILSALVVFKWACQDLAKEFGKK